MEHNAKMNSKRSWKNLRPLVGISLPCRPKSGLTEAVIKHLSSLPLSRRIGSAEAAGANLTRFIRGRLPYRARYKPRMKSDGWSHSF